MPSIMAQPMSERPACAPGATLSRTEAGPTNDQPATGWAARRNANCGPRQARNQPLAQPRGAKTRASSPSSTMRRPPPPQHNSGAGFG